MFHKFVALTALLFVAGCGAETVRQRGGDGGVPPADFDASPDKDEPSLDVAPETPAGLANGVACTEAQKCVSGFCVDGVCCDSKCEGMCLSCAQAGSAGFCAPHAPGTDPDNECADQGPASCGADGHCDGAGGCRRYPANTVCAAATCLMASVTAAGTCDLQGVCQKPPAKSCGNFMCSTPGTCRITCAANAECLAPNICNAGACGGLRGQYFNNVNLTGQPVLTRIDPNLNFDWMDDPPGPGVNADLFSVRWTGTLTPRFSEMYTFYIASSDGERMFLDDMPIINNFTDHTAAEEDTGTMALTAGKAYQVRVEHYERYTNASIRLSWSSASEPKAVIPTSAFSPPAAP